MRARFMLVLVLGLTGCDDQSAGSSDGGAGGGGGGAVDAAGGAGGGAPGDASVPLPPVVVPLDTAVGGKTQAQWAAEWWIDLYEIPDSQGWPGDTTGMNCANNQPAQDVWYLAGTWGGTERRTCTIPAGRNLFFPLVNSMNNYPCRDPDLLPPPPPGENLRDYLMAGCAELIDLTTQLEVQVDGLEVAGLFDRRIQSDIFTIRADMSQLEFDSCATGLDQDAVTDGYWVMLAPLSPGHHTLHLRALTDDGNETFENEAFYELEVTP